MARTSEPTPFYIRTKSDETFHVETLEEALKEFLGENGYRLTLIAGNDELVIRRESMWITDTFALGQNATATIHKRKRSN